MFSFHEDFQLPSSQIKTLRRVESVPGQLISHPSKSATPNAAQTSKGQSTFSAIILCLFFGISGCVEIKSHTAIPAWIAESFFPLSAVSDITSFPSFIHDPVSPATLFPATLFIFIILKK